METAQGFQVLFPRTDLNVLVEGFPLDSANVLVSRFVFQRPPEGLLSGRKKTRMTGQVYLLDSEVPRAMAQAARNGLEISVLYSPFLDESPALKCLRLEGEGTPSNLAWAAQAVLAATGTPMSDPSPKPAPFPTVSPTPSTSQDAWQDLQDLLGDGEAKGPTLRYDWSGNGREASIVFQTDGKETAVLGEFSVPRGESQALVEEFLRQHLVVTAMAMENALGSQVQLVDFWAAGHGKNLAESLKEILSQEGLTDP